MKKLSILAILVILILSSIVTTAQDTAGCDSESINARIDGLIMEYKKARANVTNAEMALQAADDLQAGLAEIAENCDTTINYDEITHYRMEDGGSGRS